MAFWVRISCSFNVKNWDFFSGYHKMNSATFLVTILSVLPIFCLAADKSGECKSNGFFRHPDDCTRFYRCVDLTGAGFFRKYTFSCPVGTVFDETVSVCNHPWASPPCEENTEEEEESNGDGSSEDGGDSVSS